jgi:L-ascorbate metabolism protein UlaG (beta-lactamase superfamily)
MHYFGIEHEAHLRQEELLREAQERRQVRAARLSGASNTPNSRRNPLVELPFDAQTLERLLARIDAVVVTHTHRDHWDPAVIELLPKRMPILCQPEDAARIRSDGFAEVLPIDARRMWRGIELIRTDRRHGTGEIGRQMAPVSGFTLRAAGEETLYIAGTPFSARRSRRRF